MARTIHVLLLIVALLACPFKCLGGWASERASAEQPAPYSCCPSPCDAPSESEPAQDQPVPWAPGAGCQCNGCLCEGAVRMDDDHDPIRDMNVVGLWLADFLPQSATAACGRLAARPGDGPPPVASAAGRSLRLVIESLQI